MAQESWLPTLWGERKGDPFTALRQQIDELFEDWTGGAKGLPTLRGSFSPRVDVSETDKEIRIAAELPGMVEKDIEITIDGRQITLKGEKKAESEEKKDEKGRVYHRVERSYGLFQRTMTMPFDLDPAKIAAVFEKGVLSVTIAKPAEAQKQARKVEIKSAAK